MDLAPDFDEFIGCVLEHRVEFLIVGAYALALDGASLCSEIACVGTRVRLLREHRQTPLQVRVPRLRSCL